MSCPRLNRYTTYLPKYEYVQLLCQIIPLHSLVYIQSVCQLMYVHVCNDHCFVYALLQVLTRLLLRMSNCSLKSMFNWPQHFLYGYVHMVTDILVI